ncbi:MAG: polyketide cyclase [Acidobacteria bacterium]|nr:polyketide cyclase [Acidobacteriota bacterium]
MGRSTASNWIRGALVGAGVTYLMDGALGSRRRALIRDKVGRLAHDVERSIGPAARDLSNRIGGIASQVRYGTEEIPDHQVLEARIRSALGRCVSYPHAIQVVACEGRVRLSGPILAAEEKKAIRHVERVRGVIQVENRLEPHDKPEDIPGLRGRPRRSEPRFAFMQTQWAPTHRFLAGAAGAGMALLGISRRGGLIGTGFVVAGSALLARAISNKELTRLAGIRTMENSVDIQKTININAPPEQVFSFWSNLENLPRFMSHVKKIEDRGNGMSHWTISGAAGIPAEFTARITEMVPNRALAWRTEPGSRVRHEGKVRFDPSNGGTRVHVHLAYTPPGGYLGHLFASVIGSDPKKLMDEDFTRIKTYMETGSAPRDIRVES